MTASCGYTTPFNNPGSTDLLVSVVYQTFAKTEGSSENSAGGKMTKEKKVKKPKKVVPEYTPVDGLSAVDRQFFEITINDLNQKLARLRTLNVQIEDRNEELESKLKQIEEDRADVMAFLDRMLHEKLAVIVELEDKLSELSKVRNQENEECQKQITTLDAKYKMMHEQLTSEIQLLTGKLNSMEEFRLQRDELLAKFDAQDAELKEQSKRHKTILYEMERKMILDKDRLRKDVESKLLQLSQEFTKSSEIRVAAHTQRLVRENIALNNEVDRVVFAYERLEKEFAELKRTNTELRNQAEIDRVEKLRLVQTCQERLDLIKKLTDQYEEQLRKNEELNVYKDKADVFIQETEDIKQEFKKLTHRTRILEQYTQYINNERHALQTDSEHYRKEFDRMAEILKGVRSTVRAAFKEDRAEVGNALFYEERRKRLVDDLLNMLTELEIKPRVETPLVKLPADVEGYIRGSLGMIPWEITDADQPPESALDTPLFTPDTASNVSEQESSVSLRIPSESDSVYDRISHVRLNFKSSEESGEERRRSRSGDFDSDEEAKKVSLARSGDDQGTMNAIGSVSSEEQDEVIVDAPDAFEEEPIEFGAIKSDSD
ncbi:sarcolemmal associated protein [Culex quinquefasciatus]|uniref:Cilia- and flagella-associated protein 157 n=1 Tax=Culex quinquefasciatus TaxID=7176 RepID=B0XIM8_CULQU|nr:sarcolemmal associated protein [Culex quinquefasciatus]|eukprot:XP_001869500.1 sarcolemmal associated protein [Culex quinquefasciatus]